MKYIQLFCTEFLSISMEMAPYLLLGFLFSGILKVFIKPDNVKKYLNKSVLRSSLNGTLLGIPLPLCSCGVIPTGISLYREGASKSATISFLISTPQTGIDSVAVTWSLMGLPFAILRVVVAFVSGIAGGIISGIFSANEKHDINPSVPKNLECKKSFMTKIIEVLYYGLFVFMADIARWLLLGIILATFINILVPNDFFVTFTSPLISIPFVLLLSIPLYICATGSVPIAAILMMKGLSPGTALVFLMAGPATNMATLTVLFKSLGKKSTFIYLISIILGAIFSGLIVDCYLPKSWFAITSINPEHCNTLDSINWFAIISTIILYSLIAYHLIRPLIIKNKEKKISETIIQVEGILCSHCKNSIELNIQKIEGIESAIVDINLKTLTVKGNIDLKKIETVIKKLGYEIKVFNHST